MSLRYNLIVLSDKSVLPDNRVLNVNKFAFILLLHFAKIYQMHQNEHNKSNPILVEQARILGN